MTQPKNSHSATEIATAPSHRRAVDLASHTSGEAGLLNPTIRHVLSLATHPLKAGAHRPPLA